MRKTSQDGGDNTSITSGIENEIKKSGTGIIKSTKNSIKRKVQNFSNENDDTANEPLLHKSKEKSEIEKQSAKFLLSKTKTDFASAKDEDKDKLLADDTIAKPSISDLTRITDAHMGNSLKDLKQDITQATSTASIHNHMNTNVFNRSNGLKNTATAKTQILVEVDTSKPSGYNASPLIFTTAKIHTDGKIQLMEPVQVTPVPISSTIEGGIVRSGVTTVRQIDLQNKDYDNKLKVSTPVCTTAEQISCISKTLTEESEISKTALPSTLSKENKGAKLAETTINIQALQQVSKLNDVSISDNKGYTRTAPFYSSSTADKKYVDINKNVKVEPKHEAGNKMEDKKAEPKLTYSNDTKSGNSQESKITTSKSPVQDINISINTPKPTDLCSNMSAINNAERRTSDLSASLPAKSIPSAVNSSVIKPNVKKQVATDSYNNSITKSSTTKVPENGTLISKSSVIIPFKENADSAKTSSITKHKETREVNDIVPVLSPKICTSKTSYLPQTSVTSETKSVQEKKSSTTNTITGKYIDVKVASTTLSNVSNVPSVSVINSTSVSSAIVTPQTTTRTATTENNKPVTINSKTTMSALTTGLKKPSISVCVTTGNTKLSSSVSSTIAGDGGLKAKSNIVATVVSSISKATTTTPNTKSLQSSSTGITKTTPTTKSHSTIKTITSVPTAKSSVISTVPHDKKSVKEISTPVNKPTSLQSKTTNQASTTTNKFSTSKVTSTVTVSPKATETVSGKSTTPTTKSAKEFSTKN